MIAEVVFDAPVDRPFTYRIPEGWTVAAGQRVLAPLAGASRTGMVIAVHEGPPEGLKALLRVLDGEPVLPPPGLDVARWIAADSLSSLGSTIAALLPPPATRATADNARPTRGGAPAVAPTVTAPPSLLVGAGRERRALSRIGESNRPALVIAPDVDGVARWARRLASLGAVARLDSGVGDAERAEGWRRLAAGDVPFAVGTRSALLAPLPPAATILLLDEHDPAHKPPGAPRLHSREIVLHRAERERLAAVLTAATPSVETWWRADDGQVERDAAPPAAWPPVTITDTRGVLRREPLTPPLARGVREALAAGQRVFLGVSRLTSALACDDCGVVVRCEACSIALAYTRAGATLVCRLCGARSPAPETCASCGGHRLSPFGWGAERVEHAVRRRFPDARVARYDPDATRGARGEAQRAAAAAADVVIGTRGALRLFGRASLGLAGFVTPDQLLRLPDFRASERAFALAWAAAERVRPDGAVVIQSQNPTHYALDAVARQDLGTFYRQELKFRAELGYPPFRRLAEITVREKTAVDSGRLAEKVAAALRGAPGLTVYPPVPGDGKRRECRLVVKGHADLPAVLRGALADFEGLRGRGIIRVEVDPLEWRS